MVESVLRRRRGVVVGSGALVLILVTTIVAWAHVGGSASTAVRGQRVNPFAHRALYVDPASRAAEAARQAEADGHRSAYRVLRRLAAMPTGIWVTPEQYPAGTVGPYVRSVVAAADAEGRMPVFVVYGIPNRDCSDTYSSGGLTPTTYGPWVREIASAAGSGSAATAILEPDALATANDCGDRSQRLALLAHAARALQAAGVTTYLDGGHAHWTGPRAMAQLLERVGVDAVRGFATNVANYQSDDDELAYAARVSRLVHGAHYVIDSGRNGSGSTRQWCNPRGRTFGVAPGYVDDNSRLDAYLWVKPPGESDGDCGGGPPAGEFWPQRAVTMARDSGW